ncbi:MAG TPA: sulfite exporter TauE/SafE family protein [Gaiellaceae bacterium]
MHALVLAVVALWCFLVAYAGGLLGLVLGNIRLPVLLLAGSSPAAVGGANIAVSGLAAAAGSITHVRAGRIDWRLVAWMLPPSVVGAIAGGYAAGHLPAHVLRVVIGSALVVFGLDLLRPRRTSEPVPLADPRLGAAVVAGAVIGAIGGLIGLILGTLRVPALIRWVREEPVRVVGTNLVIGIAVGAAGLLGHVPNGVDWTLLAVGGAASIPGALLGARSTGRLSTRNLLRAIGIILLISGTLTIVRGVV